MPAIAIRRRQQVQEHLSSTRYDEDLAWLLVRVLEQFCFSLSMAKLINLVNYSYIIIY
jgi:hypothetical protein